MQFTRGLKLIVAAAVVLGAAPGPGAQVVQQPDSKKDVQKSEKEKSPQKAEPTGIAECDRYFAIVDACVASKTLSKEDQQAAESNVSRLRTMLPIAKTPQGRDTLTERCTASLESAQKEGKYPCYKPDKTGRGGYRP